MPGYPSTEHYVGRVGMSHAMRTVAKLMHPDAGIAPPGRMLPCLPPREGAQAPPAAACLVGQKKLDVVVTCGNA